MFVKLGGFKLPFICLGALAVLIALIGAIILPQQQCINVN